MNLDLVISLVIVMATIVGTTVPLYIHTDNKMEASRQETRELIASIHADMKQFRQESQAEMKDFHTSLIKIEESRKYD